MEAELRIWHKRNRNRQPHSSFKSSQFYPTLCTLFSISNQIYFLFFKYISIPNLIFTNVPTKYVSFLLSSPTLSSNFLGLQILVTMLYQVNSSIYVIFAFLSPYLLFTASVLYSLLMACFRSVSTYSLINLKFLKVYIE